MYQSGYDRFFRKILIMWRLLKSHVSNMIHTNVYTCTEWSVILFFSVYVADLRRFRTYKGNSVRDLLRAMRNKVCVCLPIHVLLSFIQAYAHFNTLCVNVTETSLPRAAAGGAGDSRRASRRLRRLLHLPVSTVTDAHTRRPADLLTRETVSPLLSVPQRQTAVALFTHTHICTLL